MPSARRYPLVLLHRDLMQLRRNDPVLQEVGSPSVRIESSAPTAGILLVRDTSRRPSAASGLPASSADEERLLVVNLGDDHTSPMNDPLMAPPRGGPWRLVWSSERPQYGGGGTVPFVEAGRWLIAVSPRCCSARTRSPDCCPEADQERLLQFGQQRLERGDVGLVGLREDLHVVLLGHLLFAPVAGEAQALAARVVRIERLVGLALGAQAVGAAVGDHHAALGNRGAVEIDVDLAELATNQLFVDDRRGGRARADDNQLSREEQRGDKLIGAAALAATLSSFCWPSRAVSSLVSGADGESAPMRNC